VNFLPMNTTAAFGLAVWAFAGLAHAGTPALPNIPAHTTNVTQAPYNARGDGTTDNTTAIQTAINDVNARGGGTVQIPGPGVYLTGPLTMKNKINLQIDGGATLRMKPYASWSGSTPLLSCSSLSNVELSGSGGIDGQGADWWAIDAGSGLYMIYFYNCNTVLVQNVTVSNAPKQQIVFKGKCGNITIQDVTIRAPSSHVTSPSHNTDGIDLLGTNCVVRNCDISTGDDNIAIGSSGGVSADILVTNCTFGVGHGMTIGSHTESGVSNLTVINCTFNGTDYGIRMKSDNDRGGVAQNLSYFNLGMTNLRYAPISIHSYYNSDSDPTGVSPSTAAAQPVSTVSNTTPIWRNILISNLTATVAIGVQAGIIWGRTEMPLTNVVLSKVNITAPANFDLYNIYGIQFVDSRITLSGSDKTFSLYNAQVTITNSAPATNVFSMDGLVSTNSLALYNTRGTMSDASLLGANPLTLSASTLSNSTGVALSAAKAVNFLLGSNNAAVAVSGNLTLNSTLNITNGSGFGPGTYTLFTYSGSLSGTPLLGAQPPGYNCSLNTNTAKQISLVVGSPPAITNQPTGLVVLAGSNATFAVGASGSAPLSYQWWFNLTNSGAGGTNASLTVSNAQPADAGGYRVIVTNAYGAATSSVAVLTVSVPPAFGDIRVAVGGGSVVISGSGGTPNGIYYVLTSTNVAVPANQWTCVATNQFDGASRFVFTNTPDINFPQSFYLLQLP
jgi:polygalacturonase